MKFLYTTLVILFLTNSFYSSAQEDSVSVYPSTYERALKNPMMGFTTINLESHPWASLSHTYIRWNELENNESDGIQKIISVCNQKWNNAGAKNMKIIPRLYLHWDGDQKYWPADLQTDDYTSEQFQKRVLRLIERLGICWDNDPRVAFIELGIFGKWGEHHSPSPTPEMQKLVGDAFAKAFKNKKVSVRHFWTEFTDHPFGEYWDSWAHYDQMYPHGNMIKQLNETGRYKENYVGGEVAYDWGNWEIQPGATPTRSVSIQQHRDFVINTIRWLHCTQLRWIGSYDQYNADAVAGAEEMQKAFGYRYELNKVEFSLADSLKVSFDVTNTGSAPFYYKWPVEVALLDPVTHKPVWKSTFDSTDIRKWLPGEGWTDPEWIYTDSWSQFYPNVNWNSNASKWAIPPSANKVKGQFKIDVPVGTYILSLAILDPAGNLPVIKFATGNYLNGGRHPMGLVSVGENKCYPLPVDFQFNDPYLDNSLYYDDKFEINYTPDPVQTSFKGVPWQFPADTVVAWKYDFMKYLYGDKYFSLDTANTIGIYGCGDASGQNLRLYHDSPLNKDAAQFLWDSTAETFQKNGQWLEYSANFLIDQSYQLLLRARSGSNVKFRVKIYNPSGDTVFRKNTNVNDYFENLGYAGGQTDWLLSKYATPHLQGNYTIRFEWYDSIGVQGIFGGFSFLKSTFDISPPEWYYVSIGTLNIGTDIEFATTDDCMVFLVPYGTDQDTAIIYTSALAEVGAIAYNLGNFPTSGLNPGDYIVYAVDESGNISAPSPKITLEGEVNTVNAGLRNPGDNIVIQYFAEQKLVKVNSIKGLRRISIYDVLGNLLASENANGIEYILKLNESFKGVYLIRALDKNGNIKTEKFISN